MKLKKLVVFLMIVAFALPMTLCRAQNPAISKGAHIVSGLASFSSMGGDFYDDVRTNTFTLAPVYYNFIADQIGVGGTLNYTRTSSEDISYSTMGIGPKVGYFFDSGKDNIPFLGLGVHYLSMTFNWEGDKDTESGFGGQVGGGVIIKKGHLGFIVEAGYNFESYKPEGADESINGNTFYVGVGLAGLLYRE